MKFIDKDFGSNLMYAITEGLYSKDISCIREYFQNAYDPPALASRIDINLENGGVNCIIKDYGKGMDENTLKRALGVGIFTKDRTAEGVFGIGIWSGVAVCNKLVIITKRSDSDFKLRIEINAKAIREDAITNKKLTDFLTERTGEIEQLDAFSDNGKSYTIIRLEGIIDTLRGEDGKREGFSKENIIYFAAKNLPVPIDPNFAFKDIIEKEFDSIYLRKIELRVNGEKVYRHAGLRSYVRRPVLKTFSVHLKQDREVVKEIVVAKAWSSLNIEYKTLSEEDRGIDFRHHGFKIEDWSDVRSVKGGTFHERWVGEIHAVATDLLRPTAARDSFQPVAWRKELDEQIENWLKEMQYINSFVSVSISGLQRELSNLQSPDLIETKKADIIRKIQAKNLDGDLKTLEKKPEYRQLVEELTDEQKKKKETFENIKVQVVKSKRYENFTRPDIKRLVSSLADNKKLAGELNTLMEAKHEKEIKIDPFATLKEQLEEKTGKQYSSFSKAVDDIGVVLTLYPNSTHQSEHDEELKKFLKSLNMVFRNLFEHASEDTNSWFRESSNIEKLKPAFSSMIAFVSLIINEMKRKDP